MEVERGGRLLLPPPIIYVLDVNRVSPIGNYEQLLNPISVIIIRFFIDVGPFDIVTNSNLISIGAIASFFVITYQSIDIFENNRLLKL